MRDIIPFFTKFYILRTTSESLHARLSTREGSGDAGTNEAGRQAILGWKNWWEEEMVNLGAELLDANKPPEEIAKLLA